ncbi:ROK family protein [Paenibacillus guangzhouensis]|uniref:ROK family protein n=1 Tax=Paenibacillus guangzhouensis TaxID=1473112 RepID=UPI0012677E52|nr:ROK family protein [Paenibacillus guangzhouensis]
MRRGSIGIDIGGTNVKAGIVLDNGEIVYTDRMPTEAASGSSSLRDRLREMIQSLIAKAGEIEVQLLGVGVGTAGQVQHRTGRVTGATGNLPGWADMLSAAWVSEVSRLPAVVDNDVNAAALGEAWIGAGQAWNDFVCVTLGTGVGGCVILNKQPFRGRDGYAGEVGHQVIVHGGVPCNCGSAGCWEQYASVTALIRQIKAAAEQGGPDFVKPELLFEAARQGDAAAHDIIDNYAGFVAVGLANLLNIFNPSAMIIGGAITSQGDFLFERIRSKVYANVMQVYRDSETVPIVPAQLGDHAGIVGAARLVYLYG